MKKKVILILLKGRLVWARAIFWDTDIVKEERSYKE